MRKLLLILLVSVAGYLQIQAQIGVAIIGNATIGMDNLQTFTPGKSTTPTCAFPGGCQAGCPVYTFTGEGSWDEPVNWKDLLVPPVSLPSCFEIFIDPRCNTECVLEIPQLRINSCAKITVATGKKFRLPGKLLIK